MAIYELTSDSLRQIDETSFARAGIRERTDLQRLLRSQIEIVSPGTLVIAEEFGEWEDSRRRIDLLGIDQDANLVVIELKRNEDGEEMELQAIRYAAMVSTMTFEKAVEVYAGYLARIGNQIDARQSILEFLDWDEPDEDRFAQDVRIVLVSAAFSKELTTAVMWLNDRRLDIRCIRMKPYQDNGRVLIDVQQLIPLPEAAEYQVQIREKERQVRKDRIARDGIRVRFWAALLDSARSKTELHVNISPAEQNWLSTGSGVSGLTYAYVITRHHSHVELYIDRGQESDQENKAIFDRFYADKLRIETEFGQQLDWQRMDNRRACRIRFTMEGGYRDDDQQWPVIHERMVDAMIRLERSLDPEIMQLRASL